MNVTSARRRHQRQYVEASFRQCHSLDVGVGRFEHQRIQAVAAAVEEPLQGLAQRLAAVGRRHELDVAPTGGHAHADMGAEGGTVRSEKSTTGMPKTSRNVVTAPSKSRMAMAMRGRAVITASLLQGCCSGAYAERWAAPAGGPGGLWRRTHLCCTRASPSRTTKKYLRT